MTPLQIHLAFSVLPLSKETEDKKQRVKSRCENWILNYMKFLEGIK